MDLRQSYPDPQKYLEKHIGQAADRYVQAVEQGGLQPSKTLERAIAQRAFEEGEAHYKQDCEGILIHNVSLVERRYRKRENELKRQGAKMRLWTCPPVTLILGLFAWACFSQSDWLMTGIYAAGSLAFLGMLVGGAIFDRPEKEVSDV